MLTNLHSCIRDCQNCGLFRSMPLGSKPVPGEGERSEIMLVGEALGAQEAELERPFVGPAGQLLNKILTSAGIDRNQCYITNTVKCNPREGNRNRPPNQYEIDACKGWLWQEIKEISPSVIILIGKVPTQTLLKDYLSKKWKMGDIVGRNYIVDYYASGVLIPVWHTSFLMQYGRKYTEQTIGIFKQIKETLDAKRLTKG